MGNRMKGCNLHHPETQGGARWCSVALHHCTTTTPLKGGWSGVAGVVLLRGGANPAKEASGFSTCRELPPERRARARWHDSRKRNHAGTGRDRTGTCPAVYRDGTGHTPKGCPGCPDQAVIKGQPGTPGGEFFRGGKFGRVRSGQRAWQDGRCRKTNGGKPARAGRLGQMVPVPSRLSAITEKVEAGGTR
jgi:hypothetical protein